MNMQNKFRLTFLVLALHFGLISFLSYLPLSGILQERTGHTYILIVFLSCISILNVVAIGTYLHRTFLKPLVTITETAQRIAQGELIPNIIVSRDDELGKLALALKEINDYHKDIVILSQTIAEGDLSYQFSPKSERDAVGAGMKTMLDGLAVKVHEASEMTDQISGAASDLVSHIHRGHLNNDIALKMLQSGSSSMNELSSSLRELSHRHGHQTAILQEAALSLGHLAISLQGSSQAGVDLVEKMKDLKRSILVSMVAVEKAETTGANLREAFRRASDMISGIDDKVNVLQKLFHDLESLSALMNIHSGTRGQDDRALQVADTLQTSLSRSRERITEHVPLLLSDIHSTSKLLNTAVHALEEWSEISRLTGMSIKNLEDQLTEGYIFAKEIYEANESQVLIVGCAEKSSHDLQNDFSKVVKATPIQAEAAAELARTLGQVRELVHHNALSSDLFSSSAMILNSHLERLKGLFRTSREEPVEGDSHAAPEPLPPGSDSTEVHQDALRDYERRDM